MVYALLYHGRCLASIINDTMNVTLMDLSNTFRSYQDDLLAALYNLPRDQSFITNSTEQTLANLKPYLGTYLVPESSLKNDAFMSNAYSVGQVLETIANDWIAIREVILSECANWKDLKCATTQTKDIMNAIISDLREVYVNNPEYRYRFSCFLLHRSQTLKLMNSLGQFGINQDDSLRDYCQACVLASQLVVNCIDHGLLLNIVLIPSTTSFFMIDVLKSAIKFLLPSLSEAAEQQFQRDLNRLMSVLVHHAVNRRRSSTTAPGRSAIIATRSRTQPSS